MKKNANNGKGMGKQPVSVSYVPKATILHRPKGIWDAEEITRLESGLMTKPHVHLSHPGILILQGGEFFQKYLQGLLGKTDFTIEVVEGVGDAQLPSLIPM